ncbi:MAG: ACT domain-containing protein [Spirochaetes bacterium]|nr:ACT domain-containing protein [Spirochaetota bacterium]
MKVRQISVFLENKNGRLAEVTRLLGENNINLRAVSIADTADFGILRLICDKPDAALKLFHENNFTAKETDVIGVIVEDKPGGLAHVMDICFKNNVNIEYLYSSLMSHENNAVEIFKVEDIDHGLEILEKNGIKAIGKF